MNIEKIKNYYQNELNQIISKLQNISNDEVDISGDELDRIQGKQLAALISTLSKRDELKLQRIQAALKKIDEGTFGFCEACDERIMEKRLIAVPGVSLCVLCAENQEKRM